jgi:hypothetical protein
LGSKQIADVANLAEKVIRKDFWPILKIEIFDFAQRHFRCESQSNEPAGRRSGKQIHVVDQVRHRGIFDQPLEKQRGQQASDTATVERQDAKQSHNLFLPRYPSVHNQWVGQK